jgi:hypothetical protein
MAITIIATPGATNANSYGTLVEADAYHSTQYHPDAAWEESDPDTQNQVLIMATKQMDALIQWVGYTTSATQSLLWPRQGMIKRNLWEYYASNVIPNEVKYCQFELARLLIYTDRTTENDVTAQGISSLKAGPIALKFKEMTSSPPVIPCTATDLLVPDWIEVIIGQQSGVRDLVRS